MLTRDVIVSHGITREEYRGTIYYIGSDRRIALTASVSIVHRYGDNVEYQDVPKVNNWSMTVSDNMSSYITIDNKSDMYDASSNFTLSNPNNL